VESLVHRSLGVEGEGGVNLSRHLTGNNLENLGAELDEQVVESRLDLLVDVLALLLLGLSDGGVDQRGILVLLGSSQDQGRVGRGILRLVLANGCKTVSNQEPFMFSGGNSTNRQSHPSH